MVKSYVVDTNVLIQAPYALQCFEDNQVILPLVVLEELDGLKKSEGERGANARRVIRFLEKLRGRGDLLKGVELEHGGFLRVESNCVSVMLPESLPEDKADNRILKVCKGLAEGNVPVVLVTKDLVLRMKAQILGIEAQDFSTEQVIPEEEQYSGRTSCFVPEERFKEFRKKGIEIEALYQTDGDGNRRIPELVENEFVILKADQSVKKTHLGRVSAEKHTIRSSAKKCRAVLSSGSADEAGEGSSACDRKRNGGDGKNLLFAGGRTGKNRESSVRRIPADSDLPPKCTV